MNSESNKTKNKTIMEIGNCKLNYDLRFGLNFTIILMSI